MSLPFNQTSKRLKAIKASGPLKLATFMLTLKIGHAKSYFVLLLTQFVIILHLCLLLLQYAYENEWATIIIIKKCIFSPK